MVLADYIKVNKVIAMIAFFRNFWRAQDTVEKRLFWIVFLVELVVTVASAAVTYFEGQSVWGALACVLSGFLLLGIGVISVKSRRYDVGYMAMFYVVGLLLVPAIFFFCGGIWSGMPMYCCAVMLVDAVAPVKARHKWLAFWIVMLWIGAVMIVSLMDVDLIRKFMNVVPTSIYAVDVVLSYVIVSLAIFCIGTFVVNAFTKERAKTESLVKKLDYLSKRDFLSGLYNRRYVIQYFENIVWHSRERFYLLMFSIDGFKEINENYGHVVGDRVVVDISKLLLSEVDEDVGECGARYGEDTFLYVLTSDSDAEAFMKSDRIRERISALAWDDYPLLNVTVSGGVVACRDDDNGFDHEKLLKKVDNLLDGIRSRGKNQIRSMAG